MRFYPSSTKWLNEPKGNMNMRTIAAIFAATFLAACAESDPVAPPAASEIAAAPVQINVEGVEVLLQAYLYRDFAPISPPNGQPMIASVRVKAVNQRALPASLRPESLHVVFGSEVWSAEPVREWMSTDPTEMEFVARGGPKWPTGSTVDVVLRLRHGNATLLLKAPAQQIHRTD